MFAGERDCPTQPRLDPVPLPTVPELLGGHGAVDKCNIGNGTGPSETAHLFRILRNVTSLHKEISAHLHGSLKIICATSMMGAVTNYPTGITRLKE
jgi:hypothetical protein